MTPDRVAVLDGALLVRFTDGGFIIDVPYDALDESGAALADEVTEVWAKHAGFLDPVVWRAFSTDSGMLLSAEVSGVPLEELGGAVLFGERGGRVYLPRFEAKTAPAHERTSQDVAALVASGPPAGIQKVLRGPALTAAWRVEDDGGVRYVDDKSGAVVERSHLVRDEVNATIYYKERGADVEITGATLTTTLPVYYDIDWWDWSKCWGKLRRILDNPDRSFEVHCQDGCSDYSDDYLCATQTPSFSSSTTWNRRQSDFYYGAHSVRAFASSVVWPNVTITGARDFQVILRATGEPCGAEHPDSSCYDPFLRDVHIDDSDGQAYDHPTLAHELGHHVFQTVTATPSLNDPDCPSSTTQIKDRLNETFADVFARAWAIDEHQSAVIDDVNSPELWQPGFDPLTWELDGSAGEPASEDTEHTLAVAGTVGSAGPLYAGSSGARSFAGAGHLYGPTIGNGDDWEEARRGLVVDAWIRADQLSGNRVVFAIGEYGESEPSNFLVVLSVTSDGRVKWFWERGAGSDVWNYTPAGRIQTGKTYHVTLARYRNDKIGYWDGHPLATGNYDVEIHVREVGQDQVTTSTWFNVLPPTGGTSGEWRIGGSGLNSERWIGSIDRVRVRFEENYASGQFAGLSSARVGAQQASYAYRNGGYQSEVSCVGGTEMHEHGEFLERALREVVHDVDCSRGECDVYGGGSGGFPLGFGSQADTNEQVIVAATRAGAAAPESADAYQGFADAFVSELAAQGLGWRVQENVRWGLSRAGLDMDLPLVSWSGAVWTLPNPDILLSGGNAARGLAASAGWQSASPLRPGGDAAVRLDGSGAHFGQTSGGGEDIAHDIAGAVTLSAWFNADVLHDNNYIVWYGGPVGDSNAPNDNAQLAVRVLADGNIRVAWERTSSGTNVGFVTSGAGVVAGAIYHLVVIREPDPVNPGYHWVHVYLMKPDGTVFSQWSPPLLPPTGGSVARWRVGAEDAAAQSGFDGVLSDIEVHTQAVPLDRAIWPGAK